DPLKVNNTATISAARMSLKGRFATVERSRRLRSSRIVTSACPERRRTVVLPSPERRTTMESMHVTPRREPWNKGKLVGQKAPFKLKDIWAIRVRLQMHERLRELALLNLGIDSKLRACDLGRLRVRDVCHGERVAARAMVLQQKTHRPVQFEITPSTREALQCWIKRAGLKSENFLFPSPVGKSPHL